MYIFGQKEVLNISGSSIISVFEFLILMTQNEKYFFVHLPKKEKIVLGLYLFFLSLKSN
jgi:hypothetical protein